MARYLIGVDEAGRGPLAGPVTVGVVLFPRNFKFSKFGLKDSKKLSPKKREEWFLYVRDNPKIFFSSASVSAKVIDDIGIQKATARALNRALSNVVGGFDDVEIMLDGLLHAPKKYVNQRTIVKGDEKIPIISLASIVAKVVRDRKMVRLSKKYVEYGFDVHKGYGTKKHYAAIKKYGVCEIHRRSYLKEF